MQQSTLRQLDRNSSGCMESLEWGKRASDESTEQTSSALSEPTKADRKSQGLEEKKREWPAPLRPAGHLIVNETPGRYPLWIIETLLIWCDRPQLRLLPLNLRLQRPADHGRDCHLKGVISR